MLGSSLILASASPRRAYLLRLLGVDFSTDVSAVEEDLSAAGRPEETACQLALAKARAVAARRGDAIVLAADTLVVFRGRPLGKPRDGEEATAFLRNLRGHWHRVITGVAVLVGVRGPELARAEVSRVLMRRYSDAEIAAYVASGDPLDKAGAYAIQHASFHPVQRVETCYTNVMGLPLCLTAELLAEAGIQGLATGALLRRRGCSFCAQARSHAGFSPS